MSKSHFTGKQWAFINHYMSNGFNGVRAAESAGYKGDYVTLSSVAYENLRKPHIKAEIEQRMKALAMGADEALARIGDMGRSDIREFMGLTTDELKDHPRANLIKKHKRTIRKVNSLVLEEKVEIEMYDAQAAVTTVMKHHGLLKDGVTININIELVSQAIEALEAAGLDPAVAFERLIQQAQKHAQERDG